MGGNSPIISAQPGNRLIIRELKSAEFCASDVNWVIGCVSSVLNHRLSSEDVWRDSYGRPRLRDGLGSDFNLSHADTISILAVQKGGRVGVDAERREARADVVEAARFVASQAEREALCRSGDPDTHLRYWTRKEAALKLVGHGFLGKGPSPDVPVGAPVTPGTAWSSHVSDQRPIWGADLIYGVAPLRVVVSLCSDTLGCPVYLFAKPHEMPARPWCQLTFQA